MRPVLILAVSLLPVMTTGCGVGTSFIQSSVADGTVVQGTVFGGSQPVSGSTVQLWQAGANWLLPPPPPELPPIAATPATVPFSYGVKTGQLSTSPTQ